MKDLHRNGKSKYSHFKGSWAVLEDHVTRVGVDFFLDLINNHEEIRLGTDSVQFFVKIDILIFCVGRCLSVDLTRFIR